MIRPDGHAPLVVGGVAGLAWACALRGWMQQFAGTDSRFTWWSLALILAPATVAGALLVRALAHSLAGAVPDRRLALAPLLMLAALIEPAISTISTGLAQGPTSGVRDLWVGLLLTSLAAVFAMAASWLWRAPGPLRPRATVAFGAVAGLAWAASLRAFMSDISHHETAFTWVGTYLWILLPGTVVGALLAYAGTPDARHRGWIVASPLLFASVLVTGIFDPSGFLDGGVGAGTIGVPLICMAGGAAVAGRGPLTLRVLAALVLASTVPIWALTATGVGGERFGLGTPHGQWAALLYWSLLATFSLAASIPQRPAQHSPVKHPEPSPQR